MIVYNYSSKPIVISIGIVPDPMGGQGQGETTILLPPEGEGGVDLCAYGIYTKEERVIQLGSTGEKK